MQNQHRQLAAILFTDIVGYTALMQENEQKAVALIKHYNTALNELVALHNGKVLNYYGDGSLCTFPSVTEAMNCAIELQKELQAEPTVPLRIGLHVGEVFFENEKALGDGVNVASRIQSLGQSNTILYSKEIFDKIRNQPEFKSVSLGSFEFKNVGQPMEVFALANEGLNIPKKETLKGKLKEPLSKNNESVRKKIIITASIVLLLIAGFFIYSTFFKKTGFTGKERSIAVLPFTNMSSDKENEYFSDGMTEEITTQLSKIGQLKVINPNSTMSLKDSKKSNKEIAEELGVTSLCKGSVRKEGNDIRITAQLIDVNTQQQIWGDKYDREFKEVFAIQSEVAQEIAYQLNATLTKDEKKKIEKKPTNNPEAYIYYLHGRHLHVSYFETQKPEYYEKSKAMFEQALKLDPNYALAHAGLADLYNTYSNSKTYSLIKTDSLIISLQLKEIDIAWKIDSTNEYINFVKGTIEELPLRNLENAFKYFKKGIQINPNDADNLWGMAMFLSAELGFFDESNLLFNRVVILDPLTAGNYFFRGTNYFLLNKPENAIKDIETTIRLEPESVSAVDRLAMVYASLNKLDSAKKLLNKSFQLRPTEEGHSKEGIAYVYAKLGNRKKALELAPDKWRVLLALGMYDEAFHAMTFKDLTKLNYGNSYLILKSYVNSKDFEPIRNDPRFLKIMESEKKEYEENKKKFSTAGILN
jgi:TolB-like protein/class 3 adenylate cyclase